MFGYVIANQDELKIKEYNLYRSYYCGLCQMLRQKYGLKGQMTLTYDLTFLILLLADLYQDEPDDSTCRCIAHPLTRHPVKTSRFTEYASDMNLLFSYYQCEDDWHDEKKFTRMLGSAALRHTVQKITMTYPEKTSVIKKWLASLHTYEENKTGGIDNASGCFGHILAEIFAWRADEWESDLRNMGFYLGKFIYLADAYEDLEKDISSDNYNPFIPICQEPDFEDRCHQILTMMLAEACRSFERLPLADNVSILRNILYSGVWTHYEIVKRNRKETNDHV